MARDPIHPGETLAEDLEALEMSAAELARQIDVPVNRITEILNGRRAITGDTALRLGRFFGTTGEFWLNLQKLFELRRAERDIGAVVARLPTMPTAAAGDGLDAKESRSEGAAAECEAIASEASNAVQAEEVLVLDSSTFIKEIGLMSQKGSALKHYLYQRGMDFVVPEAAAEEYERNLARMAGEKIGRIRKELGWLAQFCGGVGGWVGPDDDVVRGRAKELAAGSSLGATIIGETEDVRARARLRDKDERPPGHLRAGLGDCRIWEQCLELLSEHDVVFVAADKDFRGHRDPEELHPLLRAEAGQVEGGGNLSFYRSMEELLSELRSEIPPIPDAVLFDFVYGASQATIRELESNSGCRPTSTGTIEQTRLTTEAPDVIEVRLKIEDTWQREEGGTMPFELSGSCRYHLGEKRLADLETSVVHLLTTGPDGSLRAVKGSHVSLQAHSHFGTPRLPPERGTLE